MSGLDTPALVLFRFDLRIADNRALSAAADTSKPVIPVFLFDEESEGVRPLGGARRWWLHHSLVALGSDLARLGAKPVLRRGRTDAVVKALIAETGADQVFWNRRFDPPEAVVDAAFAARLEKIGVIGQGYKGQLTHDPASLRTKTGGPYKAYTPFWRALGSATATHDPVDAPRELRGVEHAVASDRLEDWSLLPSKPDWSGGLAQTWIPGEAGAKARLTNFLAKALHGYGRSRELPASEDGSSRLSPHLAHGEITPAQILAKVQEIAGKAPPEDVERLRKEVAWREFNYHLLTDHPDLAREHVNKSFDAMPWAKGDAELQAWERGRTGYPIVDAGMRQLWQTGVMHNRVRMITASFLVKHLLVDWRAGEAWFWDTLVDADPANNAANWQWVAGSGADASPFFRIFNPILQGQKFDPEGVYVKRYVPELARVPDRYIHEPWKATAEVLAAARVEIGRSYPAPIVEHKAARDRALAALRSMRAGRND